jgi:translation elongation factor EF-1alpha
MMAGQLLAAHNAAMECYRRAMISEQTFEGRRENLSQANKLSRTYAVLLDALNRHRGKGQQTVRVEHVTVQAGGQAIVGHVVTPGGGDRPKSEDQRDLSPQNSSRFG